MFYLDKPNGSTLFQNSRNMIGYVDKSSLINDIFRYATEVHKYIAIMKPRRFGKTMAMNMLSAFFTKGQNADVLFDGLSIQANPDIWRLRNQFHVFHITFLAELGSSSSFQEFLKRIQARIAADLVEAFPSLSPAPEDDIFTLLGRTGEQFIFLLDEWDAVFEMPYMTPSDREQYKIFLGRLFQNTSYVRMTLLTGVLPIACHSPSSPLCMFHEFHTFGRIGFESYYGFSEDEVVQVKAMVPHETPSLEEIRQWYDGYVRQSDGQHFYNPDSINQAFASGRCQSYWKNTGSMSGIRRIIQENTFGVREDIQRMVMGEQLPITLDGFSAEQSEPCSRNELLSSLVVYGFLDYAHGLLSIPNGELRDTFAHAIAYR